MHDNVENTLAIRLFGSHARGEADSGSDVDVLVVVKDPSIGYISLEFPSETDVSLYTETRIEAMFGEGHLFAWHLYLESIPYGSYPGGLWFESLGRPAEYMDARQDLEQFISILEDALESIDSGEHHIFEAGVCHLAFRNLGMILSYLEKGKPDFSRYAAVRLPIELRLPMDSEAYNILIACRRISNRGDGSIQTPSRLVIKNLLSDIRPWINKLRDKYDIKI